MCDQADNYLKYENYKEQNERLTRALKNHFYLEAIFIEYSILEYRTEAILRYTENLPKQKSISLLTGKLLLSRN